MKSFIALAAAATLAGGSVVFAAEPAGDRNDAAERAAKAPLDGAREPADASDRSESPDAMFVKDAISDNMLEVQLGQIAQDKTSDAQIKQFASMMVKDHSQALQKLRQVAKSSDIEVKDELCPVHQAKLQEMQKLPADAFSRKYAIGQYAHHVMDVLEFTYQAQNAQDPAIKQFASEMIPKLREHQEHAQQIAMSAAGAGGPETARTAGARVPKTGGGNTANKADDNSDRPAKGVTNSPADRDKTDSDSKDDAPAGNGRAQ